MSTRTPPPPDRNRIIGPDGYTVGDAVDKLTRMIDFMATIQELNRIKEEHRRDRSQ